MPTQSIGSRRSVNILSLVAKREFNTIIPSHTHLDSTADSNSLSHYNYARFCYFFLTL